MYIEKNDWKASRRYMDMTYGWEDWGILDCCFKKWWKWKRIDVGMFHYIGLNLFLMLKSTDNEKL
jgi:hypothetical protein